MKKDKRDKDRFWRKKGLTNGNNKSKSQYERRDKWSKQQNNY